MPTPGWLRRQDLPVDAAGRSYIDPANLDQILDQFANWRGNVNGGGKTLSNVGSLSGVGSLSVLNDLTVGPVTAGPAYGIITACGNNATPETVIGVLRFSNYAITASDKRIAEIYGLVGSAPNSGHIAIYTYNAGAPGERVRIMASGNVGIGTGTPGTILSTGTSVAPIKIATFDAGPGAPNSYGIGIQSGALTFGANINAASGTPQMMLSANGILSIGRAPFGTDPANTLQMHVSSDRTVIIGAFGGEVAIQAVNDQVNTYKPLRFSASNYVYDNLPSTNPGAGSKQMWFDPADGNRVKYAV